MVGCAAFVNWGVVSICTGGGVECSPPCTSPVGWWSSAPTAVGTSISLLGLSVAFSSGGLWHMLTFMSAGPWPGRPRDCCGVLSSASPLVGRAHGSGGICRPSAGPGWGRSCSSLVVPRSSVRGLTSGVSLLGSGFALATLNNSIKQSQIDLLLQGAFASEPLGSDGSLVICPVVIVALYAVVGSLLLCTERGVKCSPPGTFLAAAFD